MSNLIRSVFTVVFLAGLMGASFDANAENRRFVFNANGSPSCSEFFGGKPVSEVTIPKNSIGGSEVPYSDGNLSGTITYNSPGSPTSIVSWTANNPVNAFIVRYGKGGPTKVVFYPEQPSVDDGVDQDLTSNKSINSIGICYALQDSATVPRFAACPVPVDTVESICNGVDPHAGRCSFLVYTPGTPFLGPKNMDGTATGEGPALCFYPPPGTPDKLGKLTSQRDCNPVPGLPDSCNVDPDTGEPRGVLGNNSAKILSTEGSFCQPMCFNMGTFEVCTEVCYDITPVP